MAVRTLRLTLWDLVAPLARAFDAMSPAVAEHGMRVACLVLRLAEELRLPAPMRQELCAAGALHDVGAFSLRERLDLLAFEEASPMKHAVAGRLLLEGFPPFAPLARLVAFHHVRWDNGKGAVCGGEEVPMGSHLLHLADRVSVLISAEAPVLAQVPFLCDRVQRLRGDVFVPEHVDALLALSRRDFVWLDLTAGGMGSAVREGLAAGTVELDVPTLLSFSRLVCRLIDFRSGFTATHSAGVAACGRVLARLVGFSGEECRLFEIAAYLHDVGKLAVPSEILEKRDGLTPAEWSVMRGHVYHTYRILKSMEGLHGILSWSALHQERLDGSGYPFHYGTEDLPLGARVMAVADVFTALAEDRPYRKGTGRKETLRALREMKERFELDGPLVALAERNYEALDAARTRAQAEAALEYERFRAALDRLSA